MSKVVDITNAVLTQRFTDAFSRFGKMLGLSHDGKRDTYDIYGYPQYLDGDDGFRIMYHYSRRHGVANRITAGLAHSCWRDGFELRTDPEDGTTAQLVDELAELEKQGLTKKLEQADTLNRIGRFSLLFVGVPDGLELDQPLGKERGNNALSQVYFRAYAYDSVQITEFETDTKNPRYGLPKIYTVMQTPRPGEGNKNQANLKTIRVHHTRVVHLNEQALDDEVEGMGTLEPVFNRILDLDKAVGGSAEAYFRNARGKIAYEIDKDFAADLLKDVTARESFDEGVKKFTNEWQDHTIAAGAKAHSIDTPHQSPLDTIKVILWEVAGYTGIPIRVLTGEGSGQYTGEADQLAYNQLTADRQRVICAPWAWGVIELLAQAGMVKTPDGAAIVFNQQRPVTEKEQAELDNKRADTLYKIVSAKSGIGGDALDTRSALDAVGLDSVKLDDFDDGIEP